MDTPDIEELEDRIRAGIYGDDRATRKEIDDALAALRELADLAAAYVGLLK